MELTDLKIFVTVAEEGNISRAAKRLDYVQSNMTARIRKLETELGVQLFHRLPKGVELTERGIQFKNDSLKILNLSEKAIKTVQETTYPSGPLSIGIVETATCSNFMNTIFHFQKQFPQVSLSLTTGSSQDLHSQVLNHQLDGAFVTDDIKSPLLVCEYTVKDEIVLLTKKTGGSYPDLSKVTWAIFPRDCPFSTITEEWLHTEGVPSFRMVEIGSLEMILSSVRSGFAVTLLPKSVLSASFHDEFLCFYPIPEKFRYTHTNLIRHKDHFVSKAFKAFVKMFRESEI
ncbi:LysR family transcriptional regulator [Salibacterium aidingense]|uniref:LysR family transcriptional regulator n=1 Tax=Salibacterium aidingense TaxID=384933 RepID=UPI003BC4A804